MFTDKQSDQFHNHQLLPKQTKSTLSRPHSRTSKMFIFLRIFTAKILTMSCSTKVMTKLIQFTKTFTSNFYLKTVLNFITAVLQKAGTCSV